MKKRSDENSYLAGRFFAVEGDERIYVFPQVSNNKLRRPNHCIHNISNVHHQPLKHIGHVSKNGVFHFFGKVRPRITHEEAQSLKLDNYSNKELEKNYDVVDYGEPSVEEEPFAYTAGYAWLYTHTNPIKIKVL